jgi:hypothetical protein
LGSPASPTTNEHFSERVASKRKLKFVSLGVATAADAAPVNQHARHAKTTSERIVVLDVAGPFGVERVE